MRARPSGARAILVAVAAVALCAVAALSSPGDEPKGPADKAPALALDEKYEKLKGGILKSTEAEVVALMGPAHSMVRPVTHDKADIELRWQFATRIVVIGSRGRIEIDPRLIMARDATIAGLTQFNAPPDELQSIHAAIVAGLGNGSLSPVVGREMPLADAPRAHEAVMEPGALGKIVLVV